MMPMNGFASRFMPTQLPMAAPTVPQRFGGFPNSAGPIVAGPMHLGFGGGQMPIASAGGPPHMMMPMPLAGGQPPMMQQPVQPMQPMQTAQAPMSPQNYLRQRLAY